MHRLIMYSPLVLKIGLSYFVKKKLYLYAIKKYKNPYSNRRLTFFNKIHFSLKCKKLNADRDKLLLLFTDFR